MTMTEEAKRAVEHLRENAEFQWCSDCYVGDGCGDHSNCHFLRIANLIESMYAELEQVKRERDAAVETMAENPRCETCKHYTPGYFCLGCRRGDKWQWRGVKNDGT